MPEPIEEALRFTAPPPPDDPVVFSVQGESFTAIPFLPGSRYLHFSRIFASSSDANLISTLLIEEFFNEILEDAERERFWKFANDPSSGVSASLLADMFLGLFARYSAGPEERSRPTEPSSPSQAGRSRTKASSTENSPSEASTPPTTPPNG